jgi:hypothetical protein
MGGAKMPFRYFFPNLQQVVVVVRTDVRNLFSQLYERNSTNLHMLPKILAEIDKPS